jgi:hypothetical protein
MTSEEFSASLTNNFGKEIQGSVGNELQKRTCTGTDFKLLLL